jgi:hypothetical protein
MMRFDRPQAGATLFMGDRIVGLLKFLKRLILKLYRRKRFKKYLSIWLFLIAKNWSLSLP